MFEKKAMNLLIRAIKLINGYKLKFIVAIFCLIMSIVCSLMQPMIWGILVSKLFTKDASSISNLIIVILGLYLAQIIFSFLQQYLFSFLNENIINNLKVSIFAKIMNLPIKLFDKLGIGTFMSRLHEDTTAIANIITTQLINTIVNTIKAVIIGIIVFTINPILAFITLILFPSTYLVYIFFGKALKENSRQVKNHYDYYFKNIQESFSGIKEIKSLGIKDIKIKSFADISKKLKELNIKKVVITNIIGNLSMFVNYLSQIIIYSVGAYLTFTGRLRIEYFIAFTSYSQQFSSSLIGVTSINTTIQQAVVSLERIFGLIDELDYKSESFGQVHLDNIYGNIEFKNVSFGYNDETQALKNISFILEPNHRYIFVGQSGSGKSTIFNLLLRFYDSLSGEITIDGYNIKDLDEYTIRKHISVVRQDIVLFSGTIKENLLMANHNATQEDIEKACKIANIHDFIINLPNGYDTLISENGSNLSGGQKQRLSIARAILKNSKIILFDEATSSVDSESQEYLRESINKLSENHTVVIITHKLSDILDADKIFVLNQGEIAGAGSHYELIQNNKVYQRLYRSEVERYQASIA